MSIGAVCGKPACCGHNFGRSNFIDCGIADSGGPDLLRLLRIHTSPAGPASVFRGSTQSRTVGVQQLQLQHQLRGRPSPPRSDPIGSRSGGGSACRVIGIITNVHAADLICLYNTIGIGVFVTIGIDASVTLDYFIDITISGGRDPIHAVRRFW